MRNVQVYTDGACKGNPGPGGWAAVLLCGKQEKELSGGETATTNNRMELQAVVSALSALTAPAKVVVRTDSRYVVTSMMVDMFTWQEKGWKKANGQDIAHADLWEQIFTLCQTHKVYPLWVRGHSGDAGNERVDALAKSAIPA